MLEVTTVSQEQTLGVDFSDLYKKSELYQWVTYKSPIHFITQNFLLPIGGFGLNYTPVATLIEKSMEEIFIIP
jgi:hypothetical protein